jgi:ATP-binding cassette subfamily B (MDR/TAP) protein 1
MGKTDEACRQLPLEDNAKSKDAITSWRALFNFTNRAHLIALLPALILSAVSGVLPAALAIFLGKYFDALANFGAGMINEHELVQKVQINTYGLIAIGGATWLMKGGFFTLWLIFGEMQAKSVRDILFQCLLQKDLEWFEMRSTGVGSLLSRSQTYALRSGLVGTADPISDRSENYKSEPHNP